jgi:hypothetical protein
MIHCFNLKVLLLKLRFDLLFFLESVLLALVYLLPQLFECFLWYILLFLIANNWLFCRCGLITNLLLELFLHFLDFLVLKNQGLMLIYELPIVFNMLKLQFSVLVLVFFQLRCHLLDLFFIITFTINLGESLLLFILYTIQTDLFFFQFLNSLLSCLYFILQFIKPLNVVGVLKLLSQVSDLSLIVTDLW